MTENKFNPDAAKRLYEEATSIGTSKVSENDFYNSLNDSEYARIVYNRYKDKYGVNLLGAEDDSSFLSTLGYNVPYAGNKTKEQEPKFSLKRPEEPKKENKVETPESFNTRIPNIQTVKDDVTGEDVSVDMDIPKTPDMTVKMPNSLDRFKQSPLGESNLSKRIFGVDSILEQESPQEKAWKEVYNSAPEAMANLGKDEVEEIYDANGEIIGEKVIRTANEADLDRIQQIQQGIKDQYDAIDKAEGEFIKQYEEYLNNSKVNEVNSHRDEWNLVNPWERRKSNQEMEFLKQNSARYNKIMSAKKALNLQSKFAQTYADLAEYDRSVEKGEQMSAMVSSGEITEDAMKILRATKSPEASRQYIERQVKNGTMSRDTANKLLKMGDLSEKNAFGYGFTHPGYAEDFLTFGMSEIKRNFDIKSINDRLKSGKEVSDDEKNALLMYSKMSDMMSEAKMDKRGWVFEAGQGLPKTLQFIAEIGITGGASAVGKGFTRKMILESIKKYGFWKAGAKMAKETGGRLVKNAWQQAIFSPITPSSYVDYSNRVLNMSLEQENISWQDRIDALYKSYAQTWAGRFSETLDNVLLDMPVGSWLYGSKYMKPVLQPAAWIAKKMEGMPWSKQTSNLLERFGIDGMHKEILTEMADPVLQSVVTGDTEELKKMWENKEDFAKTVALHSAILGGFHGAMGYGVGAATAAIESQRVSKAYDDAMNKINKLTFVDKQLNDLKDELVASISTDNYVAQEGKNNGRTVGEILSDMDERMQYYATTDKGTAAYESDKRVFDIADYASRVGAFKYGASQNIKDQIARRMGVAKDENGNAIPMEFEHTDGNVYEFTDVDGKQYFILDNSDSAVVLMDRATGEKVIKNKSVYDAGTITQTNANDWAMNNYLLNVENWKAQDAQSQNQQAQQPGTTVPPTQAMLRGVPVPITNFDAQTGEVTVTDQTGEELTLPVNTPNLELVYPTQQTEQAPVQPEETLQPTMEENVTAEEPVAPTEEAVEAEMQEPAYVAPRGEDNDIVWNEVPAERFKQVIDEEVGSDYADGYIDMRIEDAQRKLNEHNEKQKPIASGEYKAFMEESKKLESNLAYWTNAKQEYANAVAQEVAAQNEVETPTQEEANEVAPESTVMYDAKQPEQVEAEAPVQVSKEELDANVTGWKSNGINVNVVNSIDEVTNEQVLADMKKGVKVTGWYDTKTGEVYVFAPNITDTAELDSTVIHEVVAHKGLRGLIGEKYYEQFCEKVFDSMPKELQDKYMEYPGVNGRKAAAADEYIAYLAEKEDLTAEEQKFWDRIIQFFRDWFDARLVGILKKDTITDADISKLIRMSYANIKNNAQNGVSSDNTETDTTEGEARYSIDTMYEAVGLRYEKGNDGETIIKNAKGDIVGEITEEMIDKSPLGISLVDAVKNGMITEKERKQQLSFYKDLYNMHLRVNDLDLIYAVSGALGFQPVEPGPRDVSKSDINGKKQPFAAITSNADKQYSTTIDFTTICKKTQAVINNMSTIMVKLGRGLTKEEIVDIVFKNTHKAGEPVPCPVCYVFSRWVGLGGLFDNIKRLQNKYADADVETLRRDIAILNEKVDAIAEEYDLDRTDSKKKLRKELQEELDKLSRKEEFGKKLTDKEKALADKLTEQIFQIDNLTWLTDVRTAEGYKPVPDHILFDINAGVEFASEYPLTWKFRTTRGPSMGKAASPYSPLHFGQVMLGIGKSDLKDIKDPSKNMVLNLTKKGVWNKNIDKALRASRVKAKVQNLLNGQRLQSTSDWRFEYALDQLLAMIELQNIGAKAQLYTKVAEAIPFFATCNAEVNCSLMPKGDGYKINEDGSMELVFSRVTGMDERDAFMYSSKYDNVQPILVGINDTHMRLAMRDGRITFIIPFHASGGAEAQYKSMMEALGERYDDKREDYSPYQSDRRLPEEKRTKAQNDAYGLRLRILHSTKTGKDADTGILNDAERAVLENNAILRNLYERFYGKTIDGKEIKVKDPECYQVSVGTDQSKLIFPYEYWDKTTTIETADVNGARFIEYCNALGIVPRFSGYNGQFKYNAEKDFTKDENGNPMPGYWKLLIDRKMYNNDGTYHIQMPVNVTNMDASYIDPKTPRPEISTPSRNNNPAKEAEVVKKSLQEIRDNEQKTNGGPRYRTSAEIDKEYPNWMEGTTNESGKHSTQVTKTVGTYNKVGEWIENNLGKDVEILDASSGMGLGTQSLREKGFNIEDVEPYQSEDRKQNNPATYSAYADIEKQYDYIISNAVLNVIPDDWRADVLHNMAARMKDGGKMFINTRKAGEEKSIKDKIELDTPQEVLVKRNGKIASYQKFFTPQELKSWVEQELGDGYTVEIANEKNSGTKGLAAVVVTKNSTTDPNGGPRYSVKHNYDGFTDEEKEIAKQAEAEGTYLKATNGKDTNLTPKQWAQVRTKAFKEWFGDWENDSENASKVVDENGEPLVVWRATRYRESSPYYVFNLDKVGGRGFFFTNEESAKKRYSGKNMRSYFLNIKNPDTSNDFNVLQADGLNEGTDGVIFAPEGIDDINFEAKVFNPNQIKSATENVGTFSKENDDIRYRIPSTPAEARQRAENIMKDAIDPMARELGVEVNYVTNESISDVEPGARKKRQSKGWYQDGKVYINLSTQETIDDAKETYLHEVVAHYGLRGLLKEQFEPVMQKVFASLTPTQQQSLLEIFADEVEAAEEFLASMAENDIDPTIVEKVLGVIRDALRAMGINLDNYTDADLKYLLWRSKNSLKENAGNIETARWEAKDAEVRYRTFKNGRLSANSKYGSVDKFIEDQKDTAWSVKLLQDEIIARGGIIDDTSDPYGQSTLMPQRSSHEINLFNERVYKPMLRSFSKAAKSLSRSLGISRFEANERLEDYLYARHAIERNKKLAIDKMVRKASESFADLSTAQRAQLVEIATEMYEDEYTGGNNGITTKSAFSYSEQAAIRQSINEWISEHKEVNESGLTDKEAQDIIDEIYTNQSVEVQSEIIRLSDGISNCTEFILDTWLKYGIISKADHNTYLNQYRHYVPLRGWTEKSDIDYDEVAGNAYNRGETLISLNRRAKGRTSKADSPLAYISQMATSAIIYGNKNLMKEMAFNMVKNNYDLIKDLAFIEDKGVLTHKTNQEIKAHEVQLKVKGRTTRFSFREDFEVGVAAATAIKGENVQNIKSSIVRGIGAVTRMQSRLRTSWNPVFMTVNAVRDLMFGNLAFPIKYGFGNNLKLNKNYCIGFAAAFFDAAGIPVGSSKWRQEYEAYKREGGQTGYVHMDDIKRLKRETSKILRRYQNGLGFVPQDIFKLISYVLRVMGEPAENAMRFATFKTLKDRGISERQAAMASKEITVNFNRTGAKKWPGMFYGFFNATLEGTANYFRMGFNKETAKRFWMVNAALAALSYTLSWWAKGFGGDDDDELIAGMSPEELAEYKQMKEFTNEYNRISDYVKHTNILLPILGDGENGQRFMAIPVAQSFRMASALGTTLFDMINNDQKVGDELREFAWFVMGEIQPFDVENVSLEGEGLIGNAGRAISPTPILPFVEVYQNRNFMGLPIYKESFINEELQERIEPSYTIAGRNTPEFLIGNAKELNEKLGGNEYISAKEYERFAQNRLDAHGWNYTLAKMADALSDPASVDHVLQGLFGGFYELGAGAVERYASDDETSVNDWVLARRFIKEATMKPGAESYHERREYADYVKRAMKNEMSHIQTGEGNAYLNKDPYCNELVEINEIWRKNIKELTDAISMCKMGGNTDKAEIERLEAIRDELVLQAALEFEKLERRYNK